MRRRKCKGCLWDWENTPENLTPGLCYCSESSKYHQKAQGGCEHYVSGVKKDRFRFQYSDKALRTMNHNKRVIK